MGNDVFDSLFRERANLFRSAFAAVATEVFFDPATTRLRHSGEYGMYREAIVRDFLKFIVPRALEVSTGFIITTLNDVSTQCDIVVFDPRLTPLYQEGDRQRFFPVESAFCVGEVKSKLSRQEFAEALNKLAAIKALGERIAHPAIAGRQSHAPFNPTDIPYDLPASILICQRLSFSLESIKDELDNLYEPGVLHRHKHNMILSVEDGLLAYMHKDVRVPYPRLGGHDLKSSFSTPGDDTYHHLKVFGSFMFMLTSNKTLLLPEFSDYLVGFETAGA
jgi:hypothetical protein